MIYYVSDCLLTAPAASYRRAHAQRRVHRLLEMPAMAMAMAGVVFLQCTEVGPQTLWPLTALKYLLAIFQIVSAAVVRPRDARKSRGFSRRAGLAVMASFAAAREFSGRSRPRLPPHHRRLRCHHRRVLLHHRDAPPVCMSPLAASSLSLAAGRLLVAFCPSLLRHLRPRQVLFGLHLSVNSTTVSLGEFAVGASQLFLSSGHPLTRKMGTH
jgi:hypothetical protein